jgi:hypothetical protein
MTMTTHSAAEHTETEEDRLVDGLASTGDDGAAQLATDLELVADACELVSRRLADLRADVARQRVVLDELEERRSPPADLPHVAPAPNPSAVAPLALCRRA